MIREAAIVTQSHVFLLPIFVEWLTAALVEVALFDGDGPSTAHFPVLKLIVSFLGRREQVRSSAALPTNSPRIFC
jgi:hypothetical protein